MMENKFLIAEQLPFCKGCGHSTINENLEKALQKLGYSPLDVVVVTDIGCHGIVDKNLYTHTVHGLHGRSVALGSGISAALGNKKKVIVMLGDGGATIGMQHLIDAAHRNFDMTAIVHNNMLYGMTGGQPSEFTPPGFKTPTNPEGSVKPHYKLCSLIVEAGASFVSRINGIGDFSDHLATAISKKGFSLVEVMEICPSYGVKANPGMKLTKLVQEADLDIKVFTDTEKKSFNLPKNTEKQFLINENDRFDAEFSHFLNKSMRIMIYGSAGGGVQLAAELLATAAVKSGLQVSKKGSYPVTVGIGFSAAEIILSPDEINFTGSPEPDHIIVLTEDGKEYARDVIASMDHGTIWVDTSINFSHNKVEVRPYNFTERMGMKSAALYSMFYLADQTRPFLIDALISVYNENKLSQKIEVSKFLQFI
ncbi:MAG: 2-oxoacid:acceptor oxidoreductase family protein [Bacteroidales bacterium]|nr:2-oxoacid:acceptor oxidoreductase family protein [Bacteroidales bacterium]MCF8402710.1 2-oxoacid:acceptor oxidoreductase family protein [Bacteroidales bacterium]